MRLQRGRENSGPNYSTGCVHETETELRRELHAGKGYTEEDSGLGVAVNPVSDATSCCLASREVTKSCR